MFDYREDMQDVVLDYIIGNPNSVLKKHHVDALDYLYETLDGELLQKCADGYTVAERLEARDHVLDNLDLLQEAIAGHVNPDAESVVAHFLNNEWGYFDTEIRRACLGKAIEEVLDTYGWRHPQFAEWLRDAPASDTWHCSVCGGEIYGYDDDPAEYSDAQYCAYCGVKMKEENEDEEE